ncbi:MAG: multidrug effflux MFS transporter [Coxiellaceae bacterium]|nr:multidrug effflux MFS transporter [Coxiellaceae bacterium]
MKTLPKDRRARFKAQAIVIFIAMSGIMGIDIHLASLPAIMRYMHVDATQTQQSITFYIFGMGASLLIAGPVSDKLGRRPVVITGLIIAALGSFSAVFTQHITPFLISRLVQGLGAGACAGLGRTMSVDVFYDNPREPARAYFATMLGLSPLLAPMIGGYLQHWFGWQANFVFLGGFFLVLLIIYGAFCPETNLHINHSLQLGKILFKQYTDLLRHTGFILATVACSIAVTTNIAYATLSPFIFQLHYHLSPVTYGWLTTAASVGIILGRFVNGRLIKHFSNLHTIRIGLCLLLAAGIWLTFFVLTDLVNIALILVAVFLTLFGQALISGNAMILALTEQHNRRGIAGSLFGSFQSFIIFATTLIISLFSHEGTGLLAGTYLVMGLAGFGVYLLLSKQFISE